MKKRMKKSKRQEEKDKTFSLSLISLSLGWWSVTAGISLLRHFKNGEKLMVLQSQNPSAAQRDCSQGHHQEVREVVTNALAQEDKSHEKK